MSYTLFYVKIVLEKIRVNLICANQLAKDLDFFIRRRCIIEPKRSIEIRGRALANWRPSQLLAHFLQDLYRGTTAVLFIKIIIYIHIFFFLKSAWNWRPLQLLAHFLLALYRGTTAVLFINSIIYKHILFFFLRALEIDGPFNYLHIFSKIYRGITAVL